MSEPGLVPAGFDIPDPPATADFAFEVLGPQHNEADLAAWTTSMAHIQATPGFAGHGWPVREYTLEENLGDLVRHGEDFLTRRGFTWTVLDPATRETIGCLYVYPDRDADADASIRSWVIASRPELDARLYDHVSGWLARAWPFTTIRYAAR